MTDKKKEDSLATQAIETAFLAASPLGIVFAIADAITESKPERLIDAAIDLNLSSGEVD